MSCKGGAENSYFARNRLLSVVYPGNCTYILKFELFDMKRCDNDEFKLVSAVYKTLFMFY